MERISCLMVTLDRFERFKASFACYCRQDYPLRELVVVTDGSAEFQARLRAHVAASGREDVRLLGVPGRRPLGALRNLALASAQGPLVCQWDDDDLCHSTRLSVQAAILRATGAEASFLVEQLHLFADARALSWCDWGRRSPRERCIPGTLLAYKHALPAYAHDLARGEDLCLRDELFRRGVRVADVGGCGQLYVYVFHGANTWVRAHHAALVAWAGLDTRRLVARLDALREALREYQLPAPLRIVNYANEPVCIWQG